MDFIRGQNTPYFSWDFDFKMWFQNMIKLPGLSRNVSQAQKSSENCKNYFKSGAQIRLQNKCYAKWLNSQASSKARQSKTPPGKTFATEC